MSLESLWHSEIPEDFRKQRIVKMEEMEEPPEKLI